MYTFTPNTVAESSKVNSNFEGLADGSEIADSAILPRHISDSLGAGWLPIGDVPDTVTYNGNRSYDLVFNSNDLTDTVSEGMRLQLTRTVSAPTQCTSLNGTTQYWSKTSPTGISFTVTCTIMGARKITSYATQYFGGRMSGTNGFRYGVNASGQLFFEAQPGAGTTKTITSYQSIPLNKWFRFAFRINLNGTSQILLDGVVIPSSTTGSATSLTQAGDINIGAAAGAGFQVGKNCQDAWFSTQLTASTIISYESQTLSGSETNCIGFWSFNGNGNDSSSNNNNLTANGGAVATSVDSPFGNYLGGTLEYGIVTAKAFSTNTTLTVQVPEGCAIPTSGGVSAVAYSTQKAPYLFPTSRGRWTLTSLYISRTSVAQTTAGTWYYANNTLNIPIGEWSGGYYGTILNTHAGTTNLSSLISLSTSSSAIGQVEFLTRLPAISSSLAEQDGYVFVSNHLSLSSATPYYIVSSPQNNTQTIYFGQGTSSSTAPFVILFELAYI